MKKHTIHKDPRNGNYCVWIRRNGVRRYFNLGRNKRNAYAKLAKIEKDIAQGRILFAKLETTQEVTTDGKLDMRIEEFAVRHLEWTEENRSHGTFVNRKIHVLKFLKFMGPCMTSEITRMDLERFYAQQRKSSSRKNNPGTEAMSHIRTMLKWGEDMELIELSFRKFPPIELTPAPPKRISKEDLKTLLRHADEDFKDMITFGLMTGLRPKELRELKQDQIHHNSSGTPYVLIERHKTSKRSSTGIARSVPLTPLAKAIVERQVRKHPHADNIFLNSAGTPYTTRVLTRRFIRLKERAGITNNASMYSLRHTFASIQSDSGNIETTALASLMGHSNTRTLMKYVHNSSEPHIRAVQIVEDSLKDIFTDSDDKQS